MKRRHRAPSGRERSARYAARVACASALVAALVACGRSPAVQRNVARDLSQAPPPPLPPPTGAAAVPEGPYVGVAVSALEATTRNPFAGDTAAIVRGREQFVALNCTGCHGFDSKTGLMAPNLGDNYWRYGGSDADVFNSIYEGRARGMPAWGALLSHDQIWELVSYIHSLGAMTGPRLPTNVAEQPAKARMATQHNKRQP
jgi:cytochrome c oxidase cbb3-type subunit 3